MTDLHHYLLGTHEFDESLIVNAAMMLCVASHVQAIGYFCVITGLICRIRRIDECKVSRIGLDLAVNCHEIHALLGKRFPTYGVVGVGGDWPIIGFNAADRLPANHVQVINTL